MTHRFKKLIKYLARSCLLMLIFVRGFSADAPSDALNTYSTTAEAQQWGILIEEDSVVGIVGQD